MDGVERVMVLGIFAVIVAILSIAAWGVGADPAADPAGATDGGVSAGSPAASAPRPKVLKPPVGTQDYLARHAEDVARQKRAAAQERLSGPSRGQLPADGGLALREEPALKKSLPLDLTGSAAARTANPAHRTYSVREGDSLWQIARAQFGEGDTAKIVKLIQELNPNLDASRLTIGATLKLPHELPAEWRSPSVYTRAAENDQRTYTIQEGDTLQGIALQELGTTRRWQEIYRENSHLISDPERIRAGMTIVLPNE